jgi:ribonucleoside-diphosphate reductase alpha chain
MLYKDHVNKKSMQANLGTIKSSNLCTEIVEFTSAEEVAVCNLASIVLPSFVACKENGDLHFDYQKLIEVTKIATRNLDRVIDVNYYPISEAERSNKRHRPIGLGVQGLADVFAQLRMPFDSTEASALNKRIFETIYYAAVEMSVELAQQLGPYETFAGSPASQGNLSMDLWGVEPVTDYDWAGLRARVVAHGLRNSLLVAPMPTASTSQIMGSNECFEPFTTNIYSRTTKAGNFVVVNKWLIAHLKELNHWNEDIKESIIAADGSVQHLEIDPQVKAVYKTAWEIKQRVLIDLAADRAPFVDQSQSLNLFVAQPTHAKLTGMHMYAWERGLKTGMYYLRTRAVAQAIKITVAADKEKKQPPVMEEAACTSCSA